MLSRFWLTSGILVVLFVQCVASPAQAQFAAPEAESGITAQPLVRAERQIVVTANTHATDAALETLRKGGSAADAAIAAQMVLNLVEPQSSGIGGGGFLVHFDKAKGAIASYDGRETAPAAAGPNLFLDKAGQPLPKPAAMKSGISVGVPGVVAMLRLAHERHGKLPWADLFQPAIELARKGFAVSPRLRALLAGGDQGFREEARRYFFDSQGKPWPVGHILKNPALAETLERIARDGPNAFYEGEIARDIAASVQNDSRIPGSLAASDLAAYRAKERAPVCVAYESRKVCGMGPPSSGGVAVAQALKLVEPLDLGRESLAPEPVHLMLEAESLAFADRNLYLADPDFVPQPLPGLLDDVYLAGRRNLIDPDRSHAPFTAGEPPAAAENGRDRTKEGGGTSHISIVDSEGNAVAFTTSIETAFGSGIMVHGFLLNNQLTDFSFEPVDEKGVPIANRAEGGKRPRSSMSPTIIRNEDGTLAAVLGSPGGPVIIDYVLKSIVAHFDWGLDAQRAVALPNFGALEKTALIESVEGTEGLAEQLAAMGHDVKRVPLTSGLGMIVVDKDGLSAAADPRREGSAAGD